MKRLRKIGYCLVFGLAVGLAIGCRTVTAPTPPVAPGYINSADQTMGETLAAAHAFYVRIQSDAALGSFTLNATEKAAMNALAASLNVAQPIYLAYHAGTATEAQAEAAVKDVSAKQTAVQSMGVGK